MLLMGGVLFSGVLGTQATLIGVDNSIEVSGLKVESASLSNTIYVMTLKNIKTTPLSFYVIVESTYDGINSDVYSIIKMVPASLAASEMNEFRVNLKCNIYCNADGSYRPGSYRAYADFWMLAQSQPAICQTSPYDFQCGYLQISPPVSTAFTVEPPPAQIYFKVQSCYQAFIEAGNVFCTEGVPIAEASTTPKSGSSSVISGTTIKFNATNVKEKSKFVKWVKGDGCSNIENCKTVESTNNPYSSIVYGNQIYTAMFDKIIPPPVVIKPKLTITITNPTSCTSNPVPGVYEKNLDDKLTIAITPAKNVTSNDGKSVLVSGITGYTIMKYGSPIPDITTFPFDNPMVVGTKLAVTTKEITMDKDTEVLISCGSATVLITEIGQKIPPSKDPSGGFGGGFGTISGGFGTIRLAGIGLMIGGVISTGAGIILGGRKGARI